uniref:Uncharacterized protein n=1 Tax=Chelonoidis abingdonii TaxID=106734 RepID=A0A8C0ITS1_CHEAB
RRNGKTFSLYGIEKLNRRQAPVASWRRPLKGPGEREKSQGSLSSIFSIFAFATCGGYSGHTSIKVSCPDTKNETLEAAFGYPFRLNTVVFKELDSKKCNNTWTTTHLVGDFSSSAQFFVTFAVFVFLYCMAALVLYVGYLHLYRGRKIGTRGIQNYSCHDVPLCHFESKHFSFWTNNFQ